MQLDDRLLDLKLDDGSFEEDWLKRSKAGLINGTRYFAVPTCNGAGGGNNAIATARNGRRNGAGLGFTHAREVINSAGGSIAISSEAGEFTSVLIEVPAN